MAKIDIQLIPGLNPAPQQTTTYVVEIMSALVQFILDPRESTKWFLCNTIQSYLEYHQTQADKRNLPIEVEAHITPKYAKDGEGSNATEN